MSNEHSAHGSKRLCDEIGVPRPEPALQALATISKHVTTTGKTVNMISTTTLPDGTVAKHFA